MNTFLTVDRSMEAFPACHVNLRVRALDDLLQQLVSRDIVDLVHLFKEGFYGLG